MLIDLPRIPGDGNLAKPADILGVPEDSENGLCLDRTFPQDPSYVAMMRQAH